MYKHTHTYTHTLTYSRTHVTIELVTSNTLSREIRIRGNSRARFMHYVWWSQFFSRCFFLEHLLFGEFRTVNIPEYLPVNIPEFLPVKFVYLIREREIQYTAAYVYAGPRSRLR